MKEQDSVALAFETVNNMGGLNAVEKEMLWMSYDLGLVQQANLLDPKVHKRIRIAQTVGMHEVGHETAIREGGGIVSLVTVEPSSDYLGLTKGSPNPLNPFEHWMVICAAGMQGERLAGIHDHRGCGSDMQQLKNVATYLSITKYRGRVSPESLMSGAMSSASSMVFGKGEKTLREKALQLAFRGTMTF